MATITRVGLFVKFMFFLFIYKEMLYNGHTTRRWLYDYRADVPFLCALPVRKLHSGGEAAIHHQPALSKSIAALESELNLRLVERSTRTVALTAAGEEFARACEEMLEVYRKGVNNARTAAGDISGLVRFGLPRDRVCDTFAGLRRHIEEEYPNLRLELRFYSENGLLRALDDHMADFVLAFGRPRADNVGRQSLSVSQICAVLPGGHPLAGAGELSFFQLRHEAFLVPDYKVSGVEFDTVVTYAGRNGFSPHVVQEADSIPQIFTMVACGCGIAVLSELYRFSAGEHVVFVPLRDIPPSEEHLLWRQRDDKCLNAIVELARRYYGDGM